MAYVGMVPAMMGIEHGQVGIFLIKVYVPEAIFGIHLMEVGSITEWMRDLGKSRGFTMLSHNGLVKVLWVKAYA